MQASDLGDDVELSAAQVRELARRSGFAERMTPQALSLLLWRVSTSHARAEAALSRLQDPTCLQAMAELEAELRVWRQMLHGEFLRRCGEGAAPTPTIQ